MKLEFIGMNHWHNPVYKGEDETLWVDLDYKASEADLHITHEIDGDPDTSMRNIEKYNNVELVFTPKRILWNPLTFDYQMLGRLQSDCEYYLGYGNRSPNHLWANNEKDQIEKMKFIWNSFPDAEKPHWLTMEQIEKYESEMVTIGSLQNDNEKPRT